MKQYKVKDRINQKLYKYLQETNQNPNMISSQFFNIKKKSAGIKETSPINEIGLINSIRNCLHNKGQVTTPVLMVLKFVTPNLNMNYFFDDRINPGDVEKMWLNNTITISEIEDIKSRISRLEELYQSFSPERIFAGETMQEPH